MNYNLKNKTLIMIAATLAVMITFSNNVYAQQENPAQQAVVEANDAVKADNSDFLNLEELPDVAKQAPEDGLLTPPAPQAEPAPDANAEADTGFLDQEIPEVVDFTKDESDVATKQDSEEKIPETEAPKSPFERFGNAVLSRVDNNLFNQMADIEKQTTLLQLELKKEELQSKVEALKATRQRAQQEEEARKMELELKIKEQEAQRQAMILQEQQKLKEKEMELEKLRQAKVVNDYMNEMLLANQKWIEENTKLQARVHELEAERADLLKGFKTKVETLHKQSSETASQASVALSAHQRALATLNQQITQLKASKGAAGVAVGNPFADEEEKPGKEAIDMSSQYAIMDITGKGDNVVAKLVSHDGTTFIVRRGSMLKGGEVVKNITEHYISFERDGVESYLYTGGTIMDYEPEKTFNGSDKTPAATQKKSFTYGENLSAKSSVSKDKANQPQQRGTALAPIVPDNQNKKIGIIK